MYDNNFYVANNNNKNNNSINNSNYRHIQPYQNNPGDNNSVSRQLNGTMQITATNPSLTVVKSCFPKMSPTQSLASNLVNTDSSRQNVNNSSNAFKESLLKRESETFNDKIISPESSFYEKNETLDKRMAITKAFDSLSRAANKTKPVGLITEDTDLNTKLKMEKKHQDDLTGCRLLNFTNDSDFTIQPSHSVPFTDNYVLQMASRLLLNTFDWIKNSNSAFKNLE